jgi:predicted metal-dependent peptidase
MAAAKAGGRSGSGSGAGAGTRGGKGKAEPPGLAGLRKGQELLGNHAGFQHIKLGTVCGDPDCTAAPRDGLVLVDSTGTIHANVWNRAEPQVWAWALAHARLHLGFGHLTAAQEQLPDSDPALAAARCAVVNRFLRGFKVGTPPLADVDWPNGDEETLAVAWRAAGIPERFADCGTAGRSIGGTGTGKTTAGFAAGLDHVEVPWSTPLHPGAHFRYNNQLPKWTESFSAELTKAIAETIERAAGRGERRKGAWHAALEWFVSSFPLLGAIAARLVLVADADLARRAQISVAAVDARAGEIYVNPLVALSVPEWRFVLAHEMLHAALRHGDRVAGRDPYLWNVACDYVVNGWLVEMAVGEMPDGLLHDPELAGLGAEQVYDRIAGDLRRLRKLATLRGRGLGDVLTEPLPRPGESAGAVDLDDFYRRALLAGRIYHENNGRGLLPAGLAEEIRALEQPPIPWDAKLARWFEEHFQADVPQRSYARPSRRQSSSPDIPRPGRLRPVEVIPRRTFGVVLDTSGSMDRRLLGKALGAIASYALAHDVPAARIVYCDAAAYDAGYLPVEQIGGRATVRGRGGTQLQPGIDLLLRAPDFPADAPILVITDGYCEPLTIRREHAFLLPRGGSLPFRPRGEVFEVR